MGARASLLKDVKVVIVGGGYAGTNMARRLQKAQANFTLIDARDAFHHNVAAVRAVVEPGFAQKTMIPFGAAYGDHFRQGWVNGVNPGKQEVLLSDGGTVPYDALIISTGTSGSFPGKMGFVDREEGLRQYQQTVEKVQASNKIALIGGGPVGIEVATEIATDYPDKEVTIVHSQSQLAGNWLSQEFHEKLDGFLNDMKIKRILGEKLDLNLLPQDGGATLTTDKGTQIEADLFFKCIGLWTNNEAYKDSLGDLMEKDTGRLKVNEYLQVEGHENIYSIGDCNNVPETKLAYLAQQQSKCVYENMRRQLEGLPLEKYVLDPSPLGLMLSLGRHHGLCQDKKGALMPELITKSMKSGNMFVPQYWARMGQKVPH